jgi:wyosine [tRNA(Phe)-imidazoG37] synthetase (radical SAM superfamily)
MDSSVEELLRAYREHDRTYRDMKFVYPVVSRRAGGVSIGLNLSPHKACNFDCLYCQVDRSSAGEKIEVDIPTLKEELRLMLALVLSGQLFEDPHYSDIPPALRTLKDIALSGDGEPTAESCFPRVCEMLVQMRQQGDLGEAKIVVITNATRFHKESVFAGLQLLMAHGGEIWAKLDAGTEDYYKLVDRSGVPFDQVLKNIRSVALHWPIVIQTLLCNIEGQAPSPSEIEAYGEQLNKIGRAGGKIKEVQLHTVARDPANHKVEALPKPFLEAIAQTLRAQCTLKFKVVGGRAG